MPRHNFRIEIDFTLVLPNDEDIVKAASALVSDASTSMTGAFAEAFNGALNGATIGEVTAALQGVDLAAQGQDAHSQTRGHAIAAAATIGHMDGEALLADINGQEVDPAPPLDPWSSRSN